MLIWHYLALFCFLIALCQAKTIKKAEAQLLEPWQGKYFPYKPGEPHIPATTSPKTTTEDWTGKWFPQAPGEPHIGVKLERQKPSHAQPKFHCDDGQNHLSVDYDPQNVTENWHHLCFSSNRSLFYPNMSREAILTEHFVPQAWMPPVKCLNESLDYTHQPATNGPLRPRPAVYGSYSYLPPQRYMHNLAEGAIVMLFHPCSYAGQIKQLRQIVSNCLYRHLITPSPYLSPERPLAVVAWSHILTMSVVDKQLVSQFIQKYAKLGPLALENLSRVVETRDSYNAGLQTEARLITNADDSELCGYLQQEM